MRNERTRRTCVAVSVFVLVGVIVLVWPDLFRYGDDKEGRPSVAFYLVVPVFGAGAVFLATALLDLCRIERWRLLIAVTIALGTLEGLFLFLFPRYFMAGVVEGGLRTILVVGAIGYGLLSVVLLLGLSIFSCIRSSRSSGLQTANRNGEKE